MCTCRMGMSAFKSWLQPLTSAPCNCVPWEAMGEGSNTGVAASQLGELG